MKNLSLKKLLAVVSMIAITSLGMNSTAFAKANKQTGKSHQARMFKQLDLSDQQKQEIKSIRQSKKAEMQSLRDSSKLLRQQKQALDAASSSYVSQVQNISAQQANISQQRSSLKAQIKHQTALVLTVEQRAKAETLKAKRKEKRENRRERKRERRNQ